MKKPKATTTNNKELQFVDIQKTPDPEPKPYVEFTATIEMGECDKTIKKIISENNKE